MKLDKKDLLLYLVTDRTWLNGASLADQVNTCIQNGASFIQLREKNLSHDAFLKSAQELSAICKRHNVPFVINDDVALALEVDADGVHVGQSDMVAGNVRAMLGDDKILGVSAQTVEQARAAEAAGADYLGVGAVFNTTTKLDASDVSFDTLRDICNAVSIPVIAIGGISADNVSLLAKSGICGIAVISAILAQPDIAMATRTLRKKTEEMVKA